MSARRAAERFLIGVGALALGKETNPEHPQKRGQRHEGGAPS
jgi:hypothetical protein